MIISILKKLLELSNSGNKGQREFNQSFIKQGVINFTDELKEQAVRELFVNSKILLIYGAAGTGCKNADTDVVEYSLSRSLSQTMIAEYKTKLIDKSILQRKLAELYDMAEEEVKNSQQD